MTETLSDLQSAPIIAMEFLRACLGGKGKVCWVIRACVPAQCPLLCAPRCFLQLLPAHRTAYGLGMHAACPK